MVKPFGSAMVAILLLNLVALNVTSIANASPSDSGLMPDAAIDPHIESGFPVQTYNQGGGTIWDESPSTVIANLDNDETLEIASAGFGNPSLYVWNSDSSMQRGWPANNNYFWALPSAGNFTGNADKLELVSVFNESWIVVYDENGNPLPGWPRYILGWGHVAPALADVNGDGFDEIFVDVDNKKLYGIGRDGKDLPGWPVSNCDSSQSLHTPAIADLDGDGDLEIVAASDGGGLCAFHHTGATVAGFPVQFSGVVKTFPVIGDVDGDLQPEIILPVTSTYPNFGLAIYSASGELEKSIQLAGQLAYGIHIALADFTNDGFPEIVVSSTDNDRNSKLYLLNGAGEILPGFPVLDSPALSGWGFSGAHPILVGDVDGDQQLDILASAAETYAFDRFGNLLPGFPLPGRAWAIADIDKDSRNEIITEGDMLDYENYFRMYRDTIIVYDMGGSNHGKIEWGQFGGGPHHRHVYPVPSSPAPHITPAGNNLMYLPFVSRGPTPPRSLIPGISGHATFQGIPEANVPVELQLFDGTSWITIQQQNTDTNGKYYFPNIPGLAAGQKYAIRYLNHAPGHIALYSSRSITVYKAGSEVRFTDFDVKDYSPILPADGAFVSLPNTFTSEARTVLPVGRYAFALYNPSSGQIIMQDRPSLIPSFYVYGLPSGFTIGEPYYWSFWTISPENAYSIPAQLHQVTFTSLQAGLSSEEESNLFNDHPSEWLDSNSLPLITR